MNDAEAYEYYADPEHWKISGAARKRAAPRLTIMSSVRFAPEVIEAVKDLASGEGITVGSWIRRLVQRELEQPKPDSFEVTIDGLPEPLQLPAAALRSIFAALMPALMRHGSIDLRIGPLGVQGDTSGFTTTAPVSASTWRESERERREWLDDHRHELEVVPGSGRLLPPRAIPSSLSLRPRSFACSHFSVGNVASAACELCGPLSAAA